MTIKICVILGAALDPENPQRKLADLTPYEDEDVKLSFRFNPFGTVMGVSETDHAFSFPGMAVAAIEAEKEGADAIVIESMGDTGLEACREVVNIPVIGICQVAMHTACMLGSRFAMLSAGPWYPIIFNRMARLYGLQDHYVASASIEQTPFEGFSTKHVEQKILHAALNVIKNNNVDTIIFGGSYFVGQGPILHKALKKAGHDIVVIDPLPLGIRFARAMVECGLTQSKIIYHPPRKSVKIIGYPGVKSTPGAVVKKKPSKKKK